MRPSARRWTALAAMTVVLAGCGVSDGDIEHWKHTQRGPGKITTVLVESRYPQALRVHAVRALIELKHPNANGLDLLQAAMSQMPEGDREAIVHALLPELQQMMTGTPAPPGAAAQGPTETQIKAKDAAYVLVRGDGHTAFANAEDRAQLANGLLDWVLADFNTRALAGAYTAEQIVTAIGPTAADRLTAAIGPSDAAIPVTVEVAKLINGIATSAGKTAAVARIIAAANDIQSPAAMERLKATARGMLERAGRPVRDDAQLTTVAEQLRGQYLLVLFEAIKTLAQPNGTDFLLGIAANAQTPLERRKSALSATAGQVSTANANHLLEIAQCTPSPGCDVELRGIAVDRLGETRDRALIVRLMPLFDQSNGGAADQSFTLRWKLGEAILKLGGPGEIPDFMQHLAQPRPAPFAGYTFAELNGEAQAIGDMTPTPRDVMRGFVTPTNAQPVRLLAMMFLGIKGEQGDVAVLSQYASEPAPVVGEGWGDLQLATVGAVATRSRDGLNQTLRQGQQAPGQGSPAPAQPQ